MIKEIQQGTGFKHETGVDCMKLKILRTSGLSA